MAVLEILQYPHPFLKEKADPILKKDIKSLAKTIDTMFEAMYLQHGGGLAATQVGLKIRFFIMDGSENKDQQIVAINPEIIEAIGEVIDEEGCLSFPGISTKIKRKEKIKMQALDRNGEAFELECEGYLARCIQHEIDHLDGITYFDHLSPLKRKMLEKKYFKANS